MRRPLLVAFALVAASCSGGDNNEPNNATSNNATSNNATSNNTTSNNATSNNTTSNNTTSNNTTNTNNTGSNNGIPEGFCCCEFIVDFDILEEDLLEEEECSMRQQGQCITVDPGRLTPHPCCPNATGERCGDG